jgi:hypothetical protein
MSNHNSAAALGPETQHGSTMSNTGMRYGMPDTSSAAPVRRCARAAAMGTSQHIAAKHLDRYNMSDNKVDAPVWRCSWAAGYGVVSRLGSWQEADQGGQVEAAQQRAVPAQQLQHAKARHGHLGGQDRSSASGIQQKQGYMSRDCRIHGGHILHCI